MLNVLTEERAMKIYNANVMIRLDTNKKSNLGYIGSFPVKKQTGQ